MKKLLLLVFIILWGGMGLQSQSMWEWTDPAPLTDSLTDNTNADLFFTWNENALYLIWEKATDSTASSIFMDNILDTVGPIEVIADSAVHYRNPRVMYAEDSQNPEHEFHILYESDQNGNLDIYYVTYKSDGTYSPPTALVNKPGDESHFSVGREVLWWDNFSYCRNAVAFIRNDSLLAINLMSEGQTVFWSEEIFIDTPVSDQPLITGKGYASTINYLKADTLEKHIFSSWCDQNGVWNEPEILYDSFDCRNPDNILHRDGLIWSSHKDTSWRIIHNSWYPGFYTYDFHNNVSFDPTAVGIAYGVEFIDGWVATPYKDNGVNEIFMTQDYSMEFSNFSNSGTENRNPNAFEGEPEFGVYYCWFDYLVWESYRNGHWQIWYTKVLQCAGSVQEGSESINVLSPYPNPFTNNINIEFNLMIQEKVTINIFDLMGKNLAKLTDQEYNQGTHQLRWDGSNLPAGVYLLKLTAGGTMFTTKVVKE